MVKEIKFKSNQLLHAGSKYLWGRPTASLCAFSHMFQTIG